MIETVVATAITISAATGPINIDGRLDEPAWRDATMVSEFWETSPRDNVVPPVRTEGYLTYDSKSFYVAFKCFDPDPSRIRANLSDRDPSGIDDAVGISIDTYHDKRQFVDFMVNPLGIQSDGTESEGSQFDATWDTIWDSAGQITEFGYVVEMAIPFKSLRFANSEIQEWGWVLYRLYPREYLYNLQSHPQNRDLACVICQYRTLTGMAGVQPGRNIELIPSVTASRNDTRAFDAQGLPGEMINGDEDVDGSLNATWGVTSNLTLQGALNPDFSHVEADVMQLEVNRRYALLYPEKRPFFMERANFFTTPFDVVYSRSIFDPAWGLKFTGKEGKNGYGVLVAEDEVTNLLIPANEYSYTENWDQQTTASAIRYQRDVGGYSTIGIIGTHREGGSYHNTVGGVDGSIGIGEHIFFNFQGLVADTQYPEADENPSFSGESLSGHALFSELTHDTRNWHLGVSYREIDPEFRGDLGFIDRADFRQLEAEVIKTWWGTRETFYSRIFWRTWASKTEDSDGRTTDHSYGTYVQAKLPLQTDVYGSVQQDRSTYSFRSYDQTKARLYLSMTPTKVFTGKLDIQYGDEVDYYNERLGTQLSLALGIDWKPTKHLSLNSTLQQQRLKVDEGTVFDARLYVARLYYYFNNRAYVRGLLQLRDVTRYADRYLFPVSETDVLLQTQLLFTYKINPFTLAYIGYSDQGMERDAFDLTTTNRSFFIKLSYAFRP